MHGKEITIDSTAKLDTDDMKTGRRTSWSSKMNRECIIKAHASALLYNSSAVVDGGQSSETATAVQRTIDRNKKTPGKRKDSNRKFKSLTDEVRA